MAVELARPGVEIIQEFRSSSPTIVRPTLVPFVAGAAKEIVEVTTADGLLNEQARQGLYTQLPRVISQTSFPSPRDNISEVDVEEATVKAFLQSGGSLRELERNPGESFLVSQNKATRPVIRTKGFVTATGLALDQKIVVIAIDVTARLNITKDIIIKFASVGGANLTAAQIAAQINDAVGQSVASVITEGVNSRVQIASARWGASASVTVRPGGSANTILGFANAALEHRVEASGFRAQELNNNTTLSPWIEWSKGSYQIDGVQQSSIPAYVEEETVNPGFGFIHGDGTFSASYVLPATAFTGVSSLDLKVGDEYYADGVLPNGGAVIMKVEAARFKLGILNTKLSVFDDDGKVVSAVYDESKVNTLFSSVPFAPRYAWFMAKNLLVNEVCQPAVLTGTTIGAPAETATVEAPNVATYPVALAGLTVEVDVTIDGVEQDSVVLTFTGGPFNDLASIVTALNAMTTPGFFAHPDTGPGTKLAFSTDKTGKEQAITIKASSTALASLGFVASTAYSDTGKDVEFVDVSASLLGGTQTFPFSMTIGETLVIERSADGGTTWTAGTRTFTAASVGPFADITALLAELNTAARWDGGTLPTTFTISNTGDKIRITSTGTGSLVGLRIGSSSTGIGVTTNSDYLFTSGVSDTGEENLQAQTLKFKLNDRPKVYQVLFTSDSLPDAVDLINEAIGWPVATADGGGTSLVLTSTLKGYASKIEIVSDVTSAKAVAALGFGGGNGLAVGSGRPNPDFYLDITGSVVLGAEVLRSQLTGEPFDPGDCDIYIQYRGLRKDVSPVAKNAAMLRIADVATLQTVLSPIRSDNPLGLGMFFELINAPGTECAGMGVDEISSGAPYGTVIAFAKVANFIESEEVYAVAPLTDDDTVHQLFKTHVEFMSGPTQKGERIVIINPKVPDRSVDDVVASGLSGNTTATANQFVTDVNPTSALVDEGLNPLELDYDDQVFIDITVEGELRHYSVSSVNGALVSLRTSFETGENVDGFYNVTPLNVAVINGDWSMKVRGNKLLIPGSTLPDKEKIAETVQTKGLAWKARRLIYTFPDTVKASIGGTEELLPGFYACAAIAGMTARFAPQQGFTNLPMTGFTGVEGSNDSFSRRQLDVMAAGGIYILVQEAPGAPLISRHQLTTMMTSIEEREYSITKIVDFTAKFLRAGLRNFIGTFNITQPFLDTLSTVIQGMIGFLVENGVLIGGDLNNLIQSKDAPDTVLADIILDVPYPCNYIRLTLVI
jgi:hypothetical protein